MKIIMKSKELQEYLNTNYLCKVTENIAGELISNLDLFIEVSEELLMGEVKKVILEHKNKPIS